MRTLEDYMKEIKNPELLSPEEHQIIARCYADYAQWQGSHEIAMKNAINNKSGIDYTTTLNKTADRADQAREVLEQEIEAINIKHNLEYHNVSDENIEITM